MAKIPTTLKSAHPAVLRTAQGAYAQVPHWRERLRVGPEEGIVHLTVSTDQLLRALTIVDELFRKAEEQGFEIRATTKTYRAKAGAGLAVGSHAYAVEIIEEAKSVEVTPAELALLQREHKRKWPWGQLPEPQFKEVPAGRLRLFMPARWDNGRRSNWTEGPRGLLESKLDSVLAEAHDRIRADETEDAERAAREEQRLREELARAERRRLEELRQEKIQRLIGQVEAMELADRIRRYVLRLGEVLPNCEPDDRQRIREWMDWAIGYANESNPTLHPELVLEEIGEERAQLHNCEHQPSVLARNPTDAVGQL